MRMEKDGVVLRSFIETDIEDEVRWLTTERGWIALDTPWEDDVPEDPDTVRSDMQFYFMMSMRMPESVIRPRLDIEWEGRHIGFVSSYLLNKDYSDAPYDPMQSSEGKIYALGISICDGRYRGKGIGTKALSLYIDYFRKKGMKEVCLETRPGNDAMLRVAEKLGFEKVLIKKDAHEGRGMLWDDWVLSKKL